MGCGCEVPFNTCNVIGMRRCTHEIGVIRIGSLEALRRLGVAASHLHYHHVKLLMHIDSKSATGRTRPVASLITAWLGLNSERVPSGEDNSVCKQHLFILSGVGPIPAPGKSLHVI